MAKFVGLTQRKASLSGLDALRELLQKEGTEHTKPFWGKNFWIKRLESDMVGPFGIVTDVRFRAEAEWIKSKGGMVISIQRRRRWTC